jgi:hypothetical protein
MVSASADHDFLIVEVTFYRLGILENTDHSSYIYPVAIQG